MGSSSGSMASAPMRADTRTLHFDDANQKKDRPFFCWDCCAVTIEAPEIVEDGRGRTRRGLACLLEELFNLQDLNSNGLLEESELIELNEFIAVLHYGTDFDRDLLEKKYRKIFRQNLDAHGRPVAFPTFLQHMTKVLSDYDPDAAAQEMIVEQFIAEAQLARRLAEEKSADKSVKDWSVFGGA